MKQSVSKTQSLRPYVLVVVCVCLMACGALGLHNVYGVFYKPMAEALDTGQGAITLHTSISSLVVGLVTPLVARSLAHGQRIRTIILVGAVLFLLSGIVITFAPNPAVMNVAGVVRGIGLSAASMLVITLFLGNWIEKGCGTVTGLVFCVSGIWSAIASPLAASCIQAFGYQRAYIGFTVFTMLTFVPVALLCPLTPQEVGLAPYGAGQSSDKRKGEAPPASSKRLNHFTPPFVALVTFTVCVVTMSTLSGHLSSLAQTYGYTAHVGALMLSACMVGNVASKFVFGAVADRAGVFAALACTMATTACGLLLILLNLGGQMAMLASGFLFGTCFSIVSLGISLLTRHLYGDAYADAYSIITLFVCVSTALSVTLAGFAFDLSGSYATSLIAGLVLMAVSAGCLLYLHRCARTHSLG